MHMGVHTRFPFLSTSVFSLSSFPPHHSSFTVSTPCTVVLQAMPRRQTRFGTPLQRDTTCCHPRTVRAGGSKSWSSRVSNVAPQKGTFWVRLEPLPFLAWLRVCAEWPGGQEYTFDNRVGDAQLVLDHSSGPSGVWEWRGVGPRNNTRGSPEGSDELLMGSYGSLGPCEVQLGLRYSAI